MLSPQKMPPVAYDMRDSKWQFFIDRGGTFTDIIAIAPTGHSTSSGAVVVKKFLSDNPQQYKDAAIFGIRQILNLPLDKKIPGNLVSTIKLGTTVATNALLERKGEKTALLTTAGFADILRIANQQRPDIFALEIIKPDQLYATVATVKERIDVAGKIITPLDEGEAKQTLQKLYDQGYRSIAVVLMHSVINGAHEKKLAELAQQMGFKQIALAMSLARWLKSRRAATPRLFRLIYHPSCTVTSNR